jgi:four helix bundle protein
MATAAEFHGHRQLYVWQRAMELATESFEIADQLPATGRRALADQIRRAAASVPANIAEGHGQYYRRAYARHVSIARGSLMELDTHLEIAVRAEHLDNTQTAKESICADRPRRSNADAPLESDRASRLAGGDSRQPPARR